MTQKPQTPAPADQDRQRRVLDRALTVGGYAKDEKGLLAKSARTAYMRMWRRFEVWARSNGHPVMPTSPEALAAYVQMLRDVGYARATAEEAVTAIRWRHRVAGVSPPDRVAAWYVLRKTQPTLAELSSPPLRAACREDLAAVAASCDLAAPAGLRDLLTVVLPYALGCDDLMLSALRVTDIEAGVQQPTPELTVRLGVRQEVQLIEHYHRQVLHCGGWHEQQAELVQRLATGCPACVLWQWLYWLNAVQGPLLRPVDARGHIAGTEGGHSGSVAANGGLVPAAVRRTIRRVMGGAGLDESVTRRPVTSLRLGAAQQARREGYAWQVVAARAGYPPASRRLTQLLMQED